MMIENVFEILKYWFFQKALLLSFLAAIPCAIIGTYIVIKRISMISGSISHATFGGLGISYYAGFNPLLGATVFGIACGASIGALQEKAKNRLDSILSFLWAFGMALGLIFLYLTPGYAQDLFTYLFGNIFLIGNTELIALLIINIVIIMIIYFSFQTLKIFLFDEEFSTVRNIPIKLMNITFYILIALTIIIILSIVGIVLLIAFLTLPAAISLFYQKTIKNTMIMSGIIIASTNTLGLFIAHFINLPPGPIIIMMLSLLYLISFGYETVKKKYYEKKNPIESHSCGVEIESFGIFQDYIKDGKYLEENDHIKFHKDQGKCD